MLMSTHNFYALFMEQGTGKTLPTLTHILNLLLKGKIINALVVCPKPVKGSWHRDMELFKPLYKKLLQKNVTIVNYDLIWHRDEFMFPWDCIILDESHYINNRTSKRAKCVHKLSETAKYKYILTGTPIGNSHWEEIWSQYRFLDFDIFGKYRDFEKRYCILNQYYKPCQYLRVEELKGTIFKYAYQIKKNECLDLPDKVMPKNAEGVITLPITIPWWLRGRMGLLKIGDEVAYALFEDATRVILSRMDGEWPGEVPGDVTLHGSYFIDDNLNVQKDTKVEGVTIVENNIYAEQDIKVKGDINLKGSILSYDGEQEEPPEGE